MNWRLDTACESWGNFFESVDKSKCVPGKLQYDPISGIRLELSDNPKYPSLLILQSVSSFPVLYGELSDNTFVTLYRCMVTRTQINLGSSVGSPTIIIPHRMLIGGHISDLDEFSVKEFIVELSMLDIWTCKSPFVINSIIEENKSVGFALSCRTVRPIVVNLTESDFDIQVLSSFKRKDQGNRQTIEKYSVYKIIAHNLLKFENIFKISWQCTNLFSLLVGKQLSCKAITFYPHDVPPGEEESHPLHLIYRRIEKEISGTISPLEMLLPYNSIENEFPNIVKKWFSRSEQTTLATNVFFSTEYSSTPSVNTKFLFMTQAIESYHRALGLGLYMKPNEYEAEIENLIAHIPESITGDHRESLTKRLQYGNEYSLRKRLAEMILRIPKEIALKISGNSKKFIEKVVNTRNFYTHYDLDLQLKAFSPRDAFTAAERLRILIVANLLRDIDVTDENIKNALGRNQDISYWMNQSLVL